MNIAGSISTLTTKPSAESAAQTSGSTITEGETAFSSLLQGLAGGQKQSDGAETAPPRQLVKKIEDMLAALQEIPVEELTADQQKLMSGLLEMLQQQPARNEQKVLVETGSGSRFVPVNPDAKLQSLPADVQKKLVELVKKLSDILPAATGNTAKTAVSEMDLLVPEGKTIALNAEKIAEISSKVLELTQTLAADSKKTAAIPLQPEQPVKPGLITGEIKAERAVEPEAIKVQLSATAVTAARSDGGQQQETSQQDDSKQNGTQPLASADSAKTAAAPAPVQTAQPLQAKPETPLPPAPVVRMNNLAEELGEVFKNSLRMTVSGESTQIKVNITPEHLGHLDIRLTETNGKIAAQIFTSSMAAKDALDLQLNQLRNTLIQQGLTVEKVEVVQNSSQQSLGQQNAQAEQRFQQQQDRQKAGVRDTNGYQQVEEKSASERNRHESGTMKVDYTV